MIYKAINPPIGRIPEDEKQLCCKESDQRIRNLIRGMDNRERMIVQDELNKVREGADSPVIRV